MAKQPTEKVEISIPSNLAVTAAQKKELERRFTSQLVEVLQGTHAVVKATSKSKAIPRVQTKKIKGD
jgi:hypothetical protein